MNRSVNENSVNTAIGNVCTFNESAVGHQSSSLWLLRAFRLCFGSDTLRLVRTPTEQLLQHNRLHCLKKNLTHTLTYIDNIYTICMCAFKRICRIFMCFFSFQFFFHVAFVIFLIDCVVASYLLIFVVISCMFLISQAFSNVFFFSTLLCSVKNLVCKPASMLHCDAAMALEFMGKATKAG